jgi:Tfp pilus assembly protein PilO
MNADTLKQVKYAVSQSLKGDLDSVKESTELLTVQLPAKPNFLPALFITAVDNEVTANFIRTQTTLGRQPLSFSPKKSN